MKYAKETISYMLSNFARFLLLFAMALIPSAIVAFFMDPQGFGLIIPVSQIREIEGFSDIFFLVFSKRLTTQYPYILPIALLLISVSMSYTVGMVDRHFRTGRLSLRNPLSLMNNCFLPILATMFLLAIIYLLFKFILVCVLSLLTLILGSFKVGEVIITVAIGIISVVGFCFLLVFVRPIIFTSPNMLVYGYSFKDAFGVTLKMGEKADKFQLNVALILPFAIYILIGAIMAILPLGFWVQTIVHTVIIALLMNYLTTYVMTAMFDLSGIERRDKKKYY